MRQNKLKEISKILLKRCTKKELSYEQAFNELFYYVNKGKLPDDYKITGKFKILE